MSGRARILMALAPALAAALLVACGSGSTGPVDGGNASRGHALIVHFGCGACHTIGGVQGANAVVGPTLKHFADNRYIAGRLPNTPQNTARWIRHPQQIQPDTIMPDLGLTEAQAADVAAYLYGQ